MPFRILQRTPVEPVQPSAGSTGFHLTCKMHLQNPCALFGAASSGQTGILACISRKKASWCLLVARLPRYQMSVVFCCIFPVSCKCCRPGLCPFWICCAACRKCLPQASSSRRYRDPGASALKQQSTQCCLAPMAPPSTSAWDPSQAAMPSLEL